MPSVYGEVTVARPVGEVYAYLKERYQSHVFRSVCMMTKGYVPEIACVAEQANERLTFRAAGRDSLLRFTMGGWTWSYDLASLAPAQTKVAITYRWSVWMSIISLFTVRHQAANELIETAMALEAMATK